MTVDLVAIDPKEIICFNPTAPLQTRTESWLVTLYLEAQKQVFDEYEESGVEFAPWLTLTDDERKVEAVESLPVDKKQWNIQFQELVDQKALDIADGLTEAIRGAVANIISIRERKRVKWATVTGYGDVKELARKNLPMPDSSTGRQINAFIEKHMDTIENAGVPEDMTLALIARPDKFIINTARAISRTSRNDDLTPEEKKNRIHDIVTFAVETDKAANITRKYITSPIQIPRDVMHLDDGTTLVTFLVTTEDEFIVLDAKTTGISVEYGNAMPILAETQARRSTQEWHESLQTVLAILQSGKHTLAQVNEYASDAKAILDTLVSFELAVLEGEYYTLKE